MWPLLAALLGLSVLGSPGRLGAQADDCASAPLVGPGTYGGTTAGGTSDGDASCGRSSSSPDAWLRFTAPEDCLLYADTCGSSYDTALSVHAGCPGTVENELACNDDACELQSAVEVAADAGVTYWIRVSGYQGASGDFTLNVGCVPRGDPGEGDRCDEAVPIGLGVFTGSTTGKTSDGSASCGSSGNSPDTWFSYTAEDSCLLRISTCGGATYDTVLSVHSGCPGTAANQLTCNDDACSVQSTVAVVTEPGQTYLIRISGYSGASGDFTLSLECREPPQGDGPDITISDLTALEQVARGGAWAALTFETTVCNAGSAPVDWFANPNPNHPFFAFNIYRLREDRLEQIGQSWAKHGFAASETDLCGLDCLPAGGARLGIGCADVYPPGTNASQPGFGPRAEIDPWTGAFQFEGSHQDVTRGDRHGPTDHRLRVHDDDLDPDLNIGAQYFLELYVVAHDDTDHTNSLGWKRFTRQGRPGGTWGFDLESGPAQPGPVIFGAWAGTLQTVIPAELPEDAGDGRCYLAAKAADRGDGTWHYEYALFNLDMDRGVQAFSIPVPSGVAVTGLGFHAVLSDAEGYSNDPWAVERTPEAVRWATEPIDVNPASNPLRWGTMYTFRFDADSPPAAGTATLVPYRTGDPADLEGATVVPAPPPDPRLLRGDCDGDGAVTGTVNDAIFLLGFQFLGRTPPRCLAACDANGDGSTNISDAVYVLRFSFSGGNAPPPPYPDCGPSELPSDRVLGCREECR